jgi:alpha/beta superfamily hydrolase
LVLRETKALVPPAAALAGLAAGLLLAAGMATAAVTAGGGTIDKRPSTVQTTFKSVDAVLAAQWDFPSAGLAPLVVIIPPGGRVDRNGWPPGPDFELGKGVYQRLAELLVDKGYAVFRFDAPGAGRSSPGHWATDRSNALEAYTRAIDHARVDTDRVFLVGHGSGTATIGAIFERFEQANPLNGVALLGNQVGERLALSLTSPLLLVVGDKYPDDLYQHGRFVLDAREHNEGSKLETTLVSIEGSDSSLIREVSDNGSPGLELRPEATKALLAWLANHRS